MRKIKTVQIRGDIISNNLKWIYDWLEWDATCPKDIKDAITSLETGEELRILVNSGGGDVFAGQEIYSLLRKCKNSVAEIESLAGSAAGVAAMGANRVIMSPVAMIMIHNVAMSGSMCGDYHLYEKHAETLKNMNAALAQAYCEKTGKTEEEILNLMDKETWLTANQSVEMGFADEVKTDNASFVNSYEGLRLTEEIKQRVIKEKESFENQEKQKKALLDDLDMYGV